MARVPAAIRNKNPGAMWPGKIATKWGSTKFENLADGQGNKIATFDTWVQGICAQLDLWRTSPNYKDKPFKVAIDTWDGHNNTPSYIAYVLKRVPGMTANTIMNDAFWSGPMGMEFLKAQAGHEAGQPMPVADADWARAQAIVFKKQAPVSEGKPLKPVAPTKSKSKTPIDDAVNQGLKDLEPK